MKRENRCVFLLTDKEKERLAKEADKEGLNEAGYVRQMLFRHWEKMDQERHQNED